ncbi:MAG: M20/M25/M40 family metallo-hydrolase [Clostridia bacterium]|nr:M20/M25/M40 family metallo-hydrolase [Clostridia bacterium]
MGINGQREFDLLNKIGFIRTAGSAEELKAAEILKAEVESMGLEAKIEPFEIWDAVCEKAELEVIEPYQKKYTVTCYKGCADCENLEAEFAYVDNGGDVALKNVKGKIVLVNGYLRYPLYKKLMDAGVAGFITYSGTLLETEDDSDLFTRTLRETLRTVGVIPGVNMRATDAFDMVKNHASKVRMTTKNHEITLESRNVTTEIKGTKYPDEVVVFGAHMDSVPFSTGVYDNGAGSVIHMEVLRHFVENPPARTIRFCWYGSEEIGLEGSKAWVRDHKDELKNVVYMINTDVGGCVLGSDTAIVLGSKEFTNYTDAYMKANGFDVDVKQDIYSSDCVPFADNGIPSINFMRFSRDGGAFIHCRHDIIDFLSGDSLAKTTEYVTAFADHVVNSVVFPEKRAIPEEMKEKVDKYLYKKEMEEAKKAKEEK